MFDQLLNVAKRHLGQRVWPLGDDLDALRSWLGPDERVEHLVRGYDDDAALRRDGVISEDEFQSEKRKLLVHG
jgi:hypothetical protein